MKLAEFISRYGDERDARILLETLRWPGGVSCPKCNADRHPQKAYKQMYICWHCGVHFSVTSHFEMHNSRFPIAGWMLAIYLVSAHRKITSTRLALMLGTQRRTGWTLRERIREMIENHHWAERLFELEPPPLPEPAPGAELAPVQASLAWSESDCFSTSPGEMGISD